MPLSPELDCFVVVPETVLPNGEVVESFLVSQFLCTPGKINMQSGASFSLGKRQAASIGHGIPWTNITFFDAKKACEASGYSLLTERQWLAIAWNCTAVDANWTGGKRGKGNLIQGLIGGEIAQPQPISYTVDLPHCRRWLLLSNDELIFDFGGNAEHWVFDDIHGDQDGLVAPEWIDKDDISFQAPARPKQRGTGWRPNPEIGHPCKRMALVRGGCWSSSMGGGIFALTDAAPMYAHLNRGFRCTKPNADK